MIFDWKTIATSTVRMAAGWHFLYEGIAKFLTKDWSAEAYLSGATGFMAGCYHWMASSPEILKWVDMLNVYGLVIIGLLLFTGFLTRIAAAAGTLLLILYYFAYPPFGAAMPGMADGSVFIVNKLFIESIVLIWLAFYGHKSHGVDWLIWLLKRKKDLGYVFSEDRRTALRNLISLPILGLMGWGVFEQHKRYGSDASSGATIKLNRLSINELKGSLPKGKIMKHEISRLVMGGNLIGGWAHGRDLLYVSQLFKAYNTEKKIFETLMLGEQAGINTINIGFPTVPVMTKYKQITGSKINVISQIGISDGSKDIFDNVTTAIDNGINIIQLNGEWTDKLVRENRMEVIAKLLERIRSEGCTAGLGAHEVESLIACEEAGVIPDYYMKTMHHHNYWSVRNHDNTEKDNMFCPNPELTVEFVNRAKIPVMGFKVLAAGAIAPEDGFKWAFNNGADFICVGMFDFQIVKDVNICMDTLNSLDKRTRQWYG